MRRFSFAVCALLVWGATFAPTRLAAQSPPGPSDSLPGERASGPAAARSPTSVAPAAGERGSIPTDPTALRSWLLARLIVDRNLNGEQAAELERKLANVSDAQVDVVARVYREKREQQAASEANQLNLAKENLDQLKHVRDAAANELTSWRDYREAQYQNYLGGPGQSIAPANTFGYAGAGGYGAGGYGPGGYGAGGYGPYSAGGFPFGSYPFGYGYGVGVFPNYATPYPISPYYSAGYLAPVVGGAYPLYGGVGVGVGLGIY